MRSSSFTTVALVFVVLLLQHCESTTKQFNERNAKKCGIDFKNTIQENDQYNMVDYPYVYNGGGVGIGDLDGDGLPEILFTGNQVPSRLYKNLGGWKFQDITYTAGLTLNGWCTGVTFADVNADGLLDIYICRSGNTTPDQRRNRCFINLGKLRFRESAAELGIDDSGWSTQATFFDFDRDGDLDLYVLNHTNEDRYPNRIKTARKLNTESSATDRLYRNDQGHFHDVTAKAGIGDDGWGLGVGLGDFNQDGWTDLYISNDFLANDLLYLNQRNGTFINIAASALKHTSHFSMGNDVADFDNDGLPDVFVADMMPSTNAQRKKMAGMLSPQAYAMVLANGYQPQYMRNTLQKNQGIEPNGVDGDVPRFSEISQLAGLNATDWSWGPLFADFDGDGWKDLFIANGYRHDIIDMDFILQNNEIGKVMSLDLADQQIKQKARLQPGYASINQFFKNNSDLTFSQKTADWSSGKPNYSNGAAYGDLDNDGDLDLVTNNLDELPSLYENHSTDAHWLKISLHDQGKNPFALGAKIQVFLPGKIIQHQDVFPSRGFQSASSTDLVFGLGKSTQADSICVVWPNGERQKIVPPPGKYRIHINKNSVLSPVNAIGRINTLLSTTALNLNWKHQESPFIDFNYEPLLIHGFSNEGPPLCSGDINNDGLIDVFIGGATGQSGCFLIQQKNGDFKELLLEKGEKPAEDNGCLLFDADNDHDLDLFVTSGSNEYAPNDLAYQNRLYLNLGKSKWERSQNRIPDAFTPSSVVTATDFDLDGDVDLFVGGRRTLAQYGLAGNSQLLVNNGKGFFTDETDRLAPGLKNCGMVTAAKWVDLDGNHRPDLIIAGEWMPITIFYNQSTLKKHTISETEGFWNTLDIGDLDQDGDVDLVAGNIGRNNKFNIGSNTPLQLYGADFDGNGSYEAVITYYLNGQETPIHSREDINRQIPPLRKKFQTYSAYAQAKWNEILPPTQLNQAAKQRATCNHSAWFENLGQGKLKLHPLPNSAQTAPMNACLIDDVDGDGLLDILATGNQYNWEVGGGQMDASLGWIIHNQGKGNFSVIPAAESGFWISQEGRALLKICNKPLRYLVSCNNGALLLVKK